jgi:hypothetical protein
MSIFLIARKLGYFLVCSLMLSACGPYQVTLNERQVYSPPKIYSDFSLVDEGLKNCVRQTLLDQKISRPEDLTRLICRHAGIANLEGLSHFFALQELDLAHNNLQSVSVLGEFKQLRLLKLSNNPKLLCDQLSLLKQKDLHKTLPEHCKS